MLKLSINYTLILFETSVFIFFPAFVKLIQIEIVTGGGDFRQLSSSELFLHEYAKSSSAYSKCLCVLIEQRNACISEVDLT